MNKLTSENIEYLSRQNPCLRKLMADYSQFGGIEHSFWGSWQDKLDLPNFRREGDYLSQREYGATEQAYWATFGYVAGRDSGNYLALFGEDDLFGVIPTKIGNRLVTRDLLDSILEINFLREQLGLRQEDQIKVMDIGAGYGRFAHRFTSAFPRSFVHCLDAVPHSTFLCDFYIKFRGFQNNAASVPLMELETVKAPVDIAVNIHSWSECPLKSINFWLDLVADLKTKHLFVVPHTPEFLSREKDNSHRPFLPEIEAHGYYAKVMLPKYPAAIMQSVGLYPTVYALFERG